MNEETIEYTHHYIPLTHDQLVDRLRAALKLKRFHHVLRVEQTAMELAKQNGVDVEKDRKSTRLNSSH